MITKANLVNKGELKMEELNNKIFVYEFTGTPRYTHFGEIRQNVDMRAEVAVMTRNVLVKGDLKDGSDENGGHIKVRLRITHA